MLVAFVVFAATFVQGIAGFGLGLIAMPLLVTFLGIRTATPLVALIAITTEAILLVRYRQAFNLSAVGRLSAASLLGIPLGVYVLRRADSQIITTILGGIITAYALYALFSPRLPLLAHRAWAYAFGFVAGMLSGAYNTSGPPVIIYGSCRRWPPAEFKSNLQGFFALNMVMVIVIHAVGGSFTPLVWRNFTIGLPALLLGVGLGFSLDRWINPRLFRQLVLILLVLLGGRLLFF